MLRSTMRLHSFAAAVALWLWPVGSARAQ